MLHALCKEIFAVNVAEYTAFTDQHIWAFILIKFQKSNYNTNKQSCNTFLTVINSVKSARGNKLGLTSFARDSRPLKPILKLLRDELFQKLNSSSFVLPESQIYEKENSVCACACLYKSAFPLIRSAQIGLETLLWKGYWVLESWKLETLKILTVQRWFEMSASRGNKLVISKNGHLI